ncbi:MAG: hypothetical protein JSR91_20710 [Proteobacteria bacterium]|nr:hypothetical protein [Pseudomonadota bacterium]
MDCGHNAATDQSRRSPGVNVGTSIEFSDNFYLLYHNAQWFPWNTGYPDAVADKTATNAIGTATRAKKLAAQLDEVKVKPADIAFVTISHTHGGHTGNIDLFPTPMLLIWKAELDWALAPGESTPFEKGPVNMRAFWRS